MMMRDVSDPALACPDMDSKSWNETAMWPQIAGREDTPGLSESTDSVDVAGLEVAGMSQEENQ